MNDESLKERLPLSPRQRFTRKVRRSVSPVVVHAIALIVALLSMWLIEKLLNFTMGHDAKFYDTFPVRYVIQTIHLAIFVCFIKNVWREFR